MHIAVIHQISDPNKFWGTAGESEPPEGITLHSALPNNDGSRAVCLGKRILSMRSSSSSRTRSAT